MQHNEKSGKQDEQKGISMLSILGLLAIAVVVANIAWIAGVGPGGDKSKSRMEQSDQAGETKQAKPAKPAIPPNNPVQGPWEWNWQGRSIVVQRGNFSTARYEQQQSVTDKNTLVLKVQLLPGEELTGLKGNFIYDRIAGQDKITTKISPDKGSSAFLVDITAPTPNRTTERVSFNLDSLEISSHQSAKFTVDWKKYRTMPSDAEGRTLINLAEQQPKKIYDGELRLTHIYYGNSSIYLSSERPARPKTPYLYPTKVYPDGIVVTNQQGAAAPGIRVNSREALAEGLSSTAVELGRSNFTDQAEFLNVQVAKIGASLVLDARIVVEQSNNAL